MTIRHWLWLLVVQSVWASSYVAMKIAVGEMPVSVAVFLRYGVASIGFLLIWAFTGFPRLARRDWGLVLALGAFNFALSPVLQMSGLQYTQSIDVSILIAFEPIITVLVAAVALREQPNRRTMITLLVATAGLLILSGGGNSGAEGGQNLRLFGNLLFLSGLVFEAAVSVGGRALAPRYRADHLIGAMMITGFLAGAVINFPAISTIRVDQIGWPGWSAVLFLGIGCSIFTYLVWFRVLADLPVNRVALSLFIQPLVGTLLGSALLGEEIDVRMLMGAILICASLVWWQLREARLTAAATDTPVKLMPTQE